VDSARSLYLRFRQLIHEGAKFGVVGIIGVIITDGGTNLLKSHASMSWLEATTVATVVATAFAYVASRYWTFRHRERTNVRRETIMFFVLNGIGLLIQLACVDFVVHVLGEQGKVPANIALLVGIALGTIFRWFSYRKWVWADKPKDAPVGHESLDPVLAPAPSRPTADVTNSKAGKPN
jgi:putative flippase GtrA